MGVEPYVDPDPALGIQGSRVRAPAIENHQRELVNLLTTAGITPDRNNLTQVAQAVIALANAAVAAATLVAPATLRWSASNTPEVGELLCNGAAVSRVTYAALFAKIGTVHGPGDGSTTFNLPDYRGRVLVCAGQGTGLTLRSIGQTFGAEEVALTTAQMPSHTHQLSTNTDGSPSGGGSRTARTEEAHSGYILTEAAGSGSAHPNVQPSAVANVFIHI